VAIHDRSIADLGPADGDVQETSLAMTRANRIAVAQHANLGGPFRYARGSNQHATWTPGAIEGISLQDPTVCVVDGTQGQNRFAIFGITTTITSSNALWYSIYAPETVPLFTTWRQAYAPPTGQGKVDKPWVIERAPGDYLVFFFRGGMSGYSYLRTSNGEDWGDAADPLQRYDVAETIGGPPVPGTFCCQPAVGSEGAVYLAYATDLYGPSGGNGKVQVLRGVDPDGNNYGPLVFTHLLGDSGQPISFSPNHSQNSALPVPVAELEPVCKSLPYLLCDPSDSPNAVNRLYVLYHDTPAPGSSDVDAMIARFTRNPLTDRWSVVTNEIVNDQLSPEGEPADQFLPMGVVDGQGRIHVVYYDNRSDSRTECEQEAGHGSAFDAYFAVSTDQGDSFTAYNLRTDCETKRPLDFSLQRQPGTTNPGIESSWSPREYNGIAFYEANGVTRLWVAYSGAVSDPSVPDNPEFQSLVWGQQIVVGGGS